MPTIVKYILIFFVSMVPIIELRGAVPIGIAWGLNEYVTLAICIVGNMVPVPFIYLFARKILECGSKLKHGSGLFMWILQKGEKAGKKLTANSKKSGAFIALMLFVGIPLPGTGAWTGTLAASMLDFNPKKTSIAVMCGVLMAGTIMFVISLLAKVGITSIFDLFH